MMKLLPSESGWQGSKGHLDVSQCPSAEKGSLEQYIVALVRQFFILGAPVRAPGAAGARVRIRMA